MKCPHCGVEIHWQSREANLDRESHREGDVGSWSCHWAFCPNNKCRKLIAEFWHSRKDGLNRDMVWPKRVYREPCPEEVPEDVAEDYHEACEVIDLSPTAAAALARRCMQYILVKAGGAPETKMVKDKSGGQKEVNSTLNDQIEFVISNKGAPEWVVEELHPTRRVGNFAAHAKEDVTGQVLRTEPDEAEWTLEVLRTLFDFYYVAPAKAKQRQLALKEKQQKAKN